MGGSARGPRYFMHVCLTCFCFCRPVTKAPTRVCRSNPDFKSLGAGKTRGRFCCMSKNRVHFGRAECGVIWRMSSLERGSASLGQLGICPFLQKLPQENMDKFERFER
ncbi:hypothetical protein DL98DRAFT_159733 [Cadophora sp. DSE1049]|nr:hypothetical protein DL98DRAFT_159733 [Cadophora sp. DSE1049]